MAVRNHEKGRVKCKECVEFYNLTDESVNLQELEKCVCGWSYKTFNV